jgi:RNA polymerase sigma factor (TIGR02999 family)
MISAVAGASEENDGAAKTLFSMLYSELRHLAQRQLARQAGPLGVSPTTLLHQAYINMSGRRDASFPDHSQFLGYAARVMRGLIIDHVRSRRAQKRGGLFEITLFGTDTVAKGIGDRELILINEALEELIKIDAPLAEIVDLKFFCGFSFGEIAAMRGVSERTVQRSWEKARIYLYCSIRPDLSR